MGLFSTTSPFDHDVEKVTNPSNVTEDWGAIMEICDKVSATTTGPKDCLQAVVKRLNHTDPHIAMHAITLLDACVKNCGKSFHLEVASRDFEEVFRKLISKSHPKVKEKLFEALKRWAETEFKSDPQLSLVPSLYASLKREGMDFSSTSEQTKKPELSKDPNVVSSQQEEDDIALAIQLSLKDSKGASSPKQTTSLYPSARPPSPAKKGDPAKDRRKVRALYDFEAVEDNELTFKAGEIVHVIDDTDANWWKGSNQRGEGLFPANFVTADLSAEPEQFKLEHQHKKVVQFKEEVEVKSVESEPVVSIDAQKIDKTLHMLHEADPSDEAGDPYEMTRLEDQIQNMGPLIDQELEKIDRNSATLTRLATDLVEALNMYHSLMREQVSIPPPHMMGMVPPHSMYQPPVPGYNMPPSIQAGPNKEYAFPDHQQVYAGHPPPRVPGPPFMPPISGPRTELAYPQPMPGSAANQFIPGTTSYSFPTPVPFGGSQQPTNNVPQQSQMGAPPPQQLL